MSSSQDITTLLKEWSSGDQQAFGKLMPLVYDHLRRLAGRHLLRGRPDDVMQTTVLVHEAYLRLVDQKNVSYQNRFHFFAVASKAMRQILVNYVLSLQTKKRGGRVYKLSLSEVKDLAAQPALEIAALDEALTKLEAIDERKGRIVELRYFAGLSLEEAAEVMGLSLSTIKREWRMARAWLYSQMTGEYDSQTGNE